MPPFGGAAWMKPPKVKMLPHTKTGPFWMEQKDWPAQRLHFSPYQQLWDKL